MNAHRHCARRHRRDGGFTLVETTAVIAIVGTLAAAALPRMTDLAGEARYAALEHARSALSTVAVMSHAKFLINGASTQTFEDSTVALVYGYPAASQATVDAAGLGEHYVVLARGSASMSLVPRAVAGTDRAADCFLVYEQASASRPKPQIRMGRNTRAETCT